MFKNKAKKDISVKIVVEPKNEFLLGIEECIPKPLSQFLPKWWKKMPLDISVISTVKKCPSFADVFSRGYVIPMWTDLEIRRVGESTFQWRTSTEHFEMDFHKDMQFIDHIPELFNKVVLHANCPWKIITPENVACWQMPMPFFYEREWEVIQGIIHTDWHHEINQQILYYSNKDVIKIERGEPLAVYFPFTKDKFNYSVDVANEEEKQKIQLTKMRIVTKFEGSGSYIKHYKSTQDSSQSTNSQDKVSSFHSYKSPVGRGEGASH